MKKQIDGSKCLPLTLEQAKTLTRSSQVYFRFYNTSTGTLGRVRINGEVQVWKRNPDRVRVPWKYGMWEYGEINESNLNDYTLESEPFERFKNVRVCPATGQEWMLVEYTWRFLSENQLLGHDDLNGLITELSNEVIEVSVGTNREFGMHYELYEALPYRMQKFAPDGYYYGCHESDGEWGFWPIQEYDITQDHIQ